MELSKIIEYTKGNGIGNIKLDMHWTQELFWERFAMAVLFRGMMMWISL